MSDIEMNYLQAITSVSAMARENQALDQEVERLVAGAARQAKTIRTLNEEVSKLDAEVKVEQYNVEFVKQQGRKTRVINREMIKGFKAKITELCKTIIGLKGQVEHMRKQVSMVEAERVTNADRAQSLSQKLLAVLEDNRKLRQGMAVPAPAVTFITEAQAVQARRTSEGRDYFTRTQTIRIDQLGMQMSFCDEHKGDLRMVEAIAKQAARAMTEKLEEKIVETLMGKPMTRSERARAEYEMRMKQMQNQSGLSPLEALHLFSNRA